MTPDQIRADDDDADRVRSTFDRADNTARLALELAEAKREIERLRAEVESRGEQICSLVDRKAAIWERAEAAEAKVARGEVARQASVERMATTQCVWNLAYLQDDLRAALADAPAEVCAHDVGDPPEVCRCLLPRGHSGLHSCKHTEQRAEVTPPTPKQRQELSVDGPDIQRLVDASPDLNPTALARLWKITRQIESALRAKSEDEVRAWLRTMYRTALQDDDAIDVETGLPTEDGPCPHSGPLRYCNGCVVTPCPIGLDGDGRG